MVVGPTSLITGANNARAFEFISEHEGKTKKAARPVRNRENSMKRSSIHIFAAAALLVCASQAADIGIYRRPRDLIVRVQRNRLKNFS